MRACLVVAVMLIITLPIVIASNYVNNQYILLGSPNYFYYNPVLHNVPPSVILKQVNIISPKLSIENGMLKVYSVFTNNYASVQWKIGTIQYTGYLHIRTTIYTSDTYDTSISMIVSNPETGDYVLFRIHNGFCKRSHAFIVVGKGETTVVRSDDARGTNDWSYFQYYIVDIVVINGQVTAKLMKLDGTVSKEYTFTVSGLDYGYYDIYIFQGEDLVCYACRACNQPLIGYYKSIVVENGVQSLDFVFGGFEFIKSI